MNRRHSRQHITLATATVWLGWLGLFGVAESLAIARRAPWTTLSEFAWDTEVWQPMRWLLLLGLAILQAHIVGRWPR